MPSNRPLFTKLAIGGITLIAAGAAILLLAAGPMVDRQQNRLVPGHGIEVSARAESLHATLRIADLHDDLLLWDRDVIGPGDRGHTDIARLIEGNMAVQVFSTVTKSPKKLNVERNTDETDDITALAIVSRWPPRTWRSRTARALHQASKLEAAAERSDGRLVLVRTGAELAAALTARADKGGLARGARPVIGLLLTEGLHAIDGRLENVDTLFAHGFRFAGLAHFFDNDVAGSAHGVAKYGLTPLGKEVVARMEALRMTIDLAHASPRAMTEMLARATRPVIVSHTGVQGTCPGTRNLSDEQLRALAANGALIGIGFWDVATCDLSPRAIAKAIRHAVSVAGLEHVALGSDWDGGTKVAFGADELAQVTQALLDAGLSETEIRAVMGENAIRFLLANLP